MDFLGELIIELFGAILETIFESITLPKWLRVTLTMVLIVGLAAFLVFAICRFGWIVLQIILCIAALGLLIFFSSILCRISRWGILRPAKKEELPEILKMYRSVIGKPGCNWSISYPNEITLQEDFRSGNLYVLGKGKKIIGAGSIVPQNELDDILCWHFRENAREIARIVIAPEYQGKGYGKYLVNKLCRRLKKSSCNAVHLLVSTKNNHALNLYRETGFFSRGSVHRYEHDYYAFERKL